MKRRINLDAVEMRRNFSGCRLQSRGVALVASLFVALLLYFLVVVCLSRADMLRQVTIRSRQKLQNLHSAEAGLHWMIEQIQTGPNWVKDHNRQHAYTLQLSSDAPVVRCWVDAGASSDRLTLMASCGTGAAEQIRRAQVVLRDEVATKVLIRKTPAGPLKLYSTSDQSWSDQPEPPPMFWEASDAQLEPSTSFSVGFQDGGCADNDNNFYCIGEFRGHESIYRLNSREQKWYVLPAPLPVQPRQLVGLTFWKNKLVALVQPLGVVGSEASCWALENPGSQGRTPVSGDSWSGKVDQSWTSVCAMPGVQSDEFPPSILGGGSNYAVESVCSAGDALYCCRVAIMPYIPVEEGGSGPDPYAFRYWRWDGQQWGMLPPFPQHVYGLNGPRLEHLDESTTSMVPAEMQGDEAGFLYMVAAPTRRDQCEMPTLFKFEPSQQKADDVHLDGIWKSCGLNCSKPDYLRNPGGRLSISAMAGNGRALFLYRFVNHADGEIQDSSLDRVDLGPLNSEPVRSVPMSLGSIQLLGCGGETSQTGRKVVSVISWY
ncbi:hypothetical protein JST97_23370 [bacterium]|nr:hypothetical protein [bacterium]